jgi:hypothetical protein
VPRLFGAAEARTAGHGGITASSRATGLARSTIGRGLKDLGDPDSLLGKVRRPGSGRPALSAKDTTLLEDLRQLLEPATMGDPTRPLRWVSKSHAKLAAALCATGHSTAPAVLPHHTDPARHTTDQPAGRVELIASTTTKTGLTVRCELDTRTYPKGIKVSDEEMASVNIKGDAFHPSGTTPSRPGSRREAIIVGRRLSSCADGPEGSPTTRRREPAPGPSQGERQGRCSTTE